MGLEMFLNSVCSGDFGTNIYNKFDVQKKMCIFFHLTDEDKEIVFENSIEQVGL